MLVVAGDAPAAAETRPVSDGPGPTRTSRARDLRAAALQAGPAMAVVLVWSAVFLRRTEFTAGGKKYFSLLDDGMISMRYAQNLAHGHGLKWNTTGPPVEGFTNLLWTLWMAFIHFLPGDDSKRSLYVSATGVLILMANVLVARAVARRLVPDSPRVALYSCWLVALYYPILYWTLRGMEVGALALATGVAVLLALRIADEPKARDQVLLTVVLVTAILIRTDAIIPAALVVAWLIWKASPDRRRFTVLLSGSAVAAGLVIQLAVSRIYYGDWLPNTYYLKVTGIPLSTRLHRGLGGLVSIGILELYLPVVLCALYFACTRRRAHPAMILLSALFVGQCAYSAWVGGDAWEANQLANRFVSTEAIPLLIGAAVAIDTLMRAPSSTRWKLLATASLPVAIVVDFRVPDVLPASHLQLGRLPTEWWMTRVGIPVGVVVVLGLVGYFSFRRRGPLPLRSQTALSAVLFFTLLVSVGGRETTYWARHNAFLHQDTDSARLGLAVKAATLPGARVALSAAGASAYFAQRFAIDLGGLSDRTIAHESPRTNIFIPGHDKADYRWSVGVLRPDLVIALGGTTNADRAMIVAWGYDEFSSYVFVKHGSTLVDRPALGAVEVYAAG